MNQPKLSQFMISKVLG